MCFYTLLAFCVVSIPSFICHPPVHVYSVAKFHCILASSHFPSRWTWVGLHMADYMVRMVTHLGTHRARRRTTSLMGPTPVPLSVCILLEYFCDRIFELYFQNEFQPDNHPRAVEIEFLNGRHGIQTTVAVCCIPCCRLSLVVHSQHVDERKRRSLIIVTTDQHWPPTDRGADVSPTNMRGLCERSNSYSILATRTAWQTSYMSFLLLIFWVIKLRDKYSQNSLYFTRPKKLASTGTTTRTNTEDYVLKGYTCHLIFHALNNLQELL